LTLRFAGIIIDCGTSKLRKKREFLFPEIAGMGYRRKEYYYRGRLLNQRIIPVSQAKRLEEWERQKAGAVNEAVPARNS
jgi:hypothetical protein